MTIREVRAVEAAAFKDYFAQGLINRPGCFRISPSYPDPLLFPAKGASDSFPLGAFDEEENWMGTASFVREGLERERFTNLSRNLLSNLTNYHTALAVA